MHIHGDYSSYKARLINLQFVRCEGHDYCRSPEEIALWLQDKFILLLFNQIRFDSFQYAYDSIVKSSDLIWLPMSTQFVQTYPFEI